MTDHFFKNDFICLLPCPLPSCLTNPTTLFVLPLYKVSFPSVQGGHIRMIPFLQYCTVLYEEVNVNLNVKKDSKMSKYLENVLYTFQK